MVVMITTAGWNRESICWEQHDYARKVLKGIIDDPEYFAFIAAADAAVCHWIVPLMLRRSAADEIDPALKELPRALCMLGVQ